MLKKMNIECYDLDEGPITYEKIKDYDVLWLCEGRAKPFKSDEIQEIKSYVWEDNKGLLLMITFPENKYPIPEEIIEESHPGFLYPVNSWSDYCQYMKANGRDICSLDELGMEFGMYGSRYELDSLSKAYDPVELEKKIFRGDIHGDVEGTFYFENHTLTKGLKKIGMHFGSDLLPISVYEKAEPLIYLDGKFIIWESIINKNFESKTLFEKKNKFPIFAINKKYRVATLSCDNPGLFDDYRLQTTEYDNKEFAKRLFPWLCGIEEETKPIKRLPFMYSL